MISEFHLQNRSMSRTEELRQQYVKDADLMASKSRFGFFTLLPSHTAARTQDSSAHPPRGEDGKPVTEARNIFSGSTSTPYLQKNYFSYTPSPFHGSEYQDPGKHERQSALQLSKQEEGKELFKPVKDTKAPVASSYPYISPHDPSKDKKNYRDSDGKVIVQPPNMLVSPQSKIIYGQNKKFKYTECPPPEKRAKTVESAPQEPFKTGNPAKHVFSSNVQTFFDTNLTKKESKKVLNKSESQEEPFKPSCTSKGAPFQKLVYKEEGVDESKRPEKKENKNEPFKLVKVQKNSKPCPSISLTKVNMLRICR